MTLEFPARRDYVENSTTFEWLTKAIRHATRSAKFCVAGCLPHVDPGIEIEGLGAVKLPLNRTTTKELIAQGEVAPYGKGTQTLVNKKVRNTIEMGVTRRPLSRIISS